MAKKTENSQADEQGEGLLIEVQEQLERERMLQFFKRYSGFLSYVAIAILLVFGGHEVWKHFDLQNRQQAGSALLEAALNDNAKIDISKFNAGNGTKLLAEMVAANKLAKTQKFAEAVAAYEAIYNDKNFDNGARELASLKAKTISLNHDVPVKSKIEPTVFNPHFQEISAIEQLKDGKKEEAKKLFAELKKNDEATPILKNRATEFLIKIDEK